MKRTAVVTGANRGIGRAIVEALARRSDMRLIAAVRRQADGDRLKAELGVELDVVALELSDPLRVATVARRIDDDFGGVDVLVNNAGVLHPGSAVDVELAQVSESIAVNAMAPFALCQVFGAGMRKRGWGRIVNVSSGWGSFADGLSGPAAYSISKATLNAVTLSMAQALGRSVKVNAVCPGWVRTRMGGQAASRSSEEGAETAVWLATLPDDGPTGGFWRDRRLIEW